MITNYPSTEEVKNIYKFLLARAVLIEIYDIDFNYWFYYVI